MKVERARMEFSPELFVEGCDCAFLGVTWTMWGVYACYSWELLVDAGLVDGMTPGQWTAAHGAFLVE